MITTARTYFVVERRFVIISSEATIKVSDVTYSHWNKSEPTLRNVSLEILPGTLTILIGPSGSGKSTLCDLFNGLIPHISGGEFEGDVFINGVSTRETPVKDLSKDIGRVFQDPETMFATLYVEDEIAFGPENLCFDPEMIRKDVEVLLRSTGLIQHRKSLVWHLSGGQMQKLGLATVLATHPSVVVLDEPTSNLDPAASHEINQQMLQMRAEGITVVVVTKELDDFLAQADQLIVLDDGEIFAAGPPRDILLAHGKHLIEQLGVWLPETSEIDIVLREKNLIKNKHVSITIDEMLHTLKDAGLLSKNIHKGSSQLTEKEKPGPGEVMISAEDLYFDYPNGTNAINGVSIDVRRGEILAIVGRNGAGKSTLAKLFVGLLKVQEGKLDLFGKPSKFWKVQTLANHIALVFQNPEHQFLTDSVTDEIVYSLLAQGITEQEEVERRTEEILDLLDLEDVADSHPFALSAGKKRRLGVATMLVGEPQLLLVDEPTYGQDKHMTTTLMDLMKEIRTRGIGVVMITHDMRLVRKYAERAVVMSQGKVLYDGDPVELFNHNELLETANLRTTMLHDLIIKLREDGFVVPDKIREPSQVVDLLK